MQPLLRSFTYSALCLLYNHGLGCGVLKRLEFSTSEIQPQVSWYGIKRFSAVLIESLNSILNNIGCSQQMTSKIKSQVSCYSYEETRKTSIFNFIIVCQKEKWSWSSVGGFGIETSNFRAKLEVSIPNFPTELQLHFSF